MPAFDAASLQRALQATPSITEQAPGSAPSAGSVGIGPYLALAAGEGADLLTTLQTIQSGRGVEANPMLSAGGNTGLVAGKAGTALLLAYLMHKLAADGHPTAAKALGYSLGGAYGALALHNNSVGRK